MSKKKEKPYDWGLYEWKKIQLLSNNFCFYCGILLDITTATVDHKTPRSKGGLDHSSNKVLCCYVCNQRKKDMDFDQYIEKICWFH